MSPFDKIKKQINEDLHHKLPKKWKKIGNILVADFSQINTNNLSQISQVYANILKVKTVLQKNKVNGELRKPERTEILFGDDTETEITEYGLKYSMDLSKTMWSPGNTGWRAVLDGPEKVSSFYSLDSPKVIIDYFAGIGYFTIQLAKGYSNAKIISIDKNPDSIKYLKKNLKVNNIDNVDVLNDDCRNINHKADVIHLGYISNTLDFLEHAHNNLNDKGIAIFHEAYNNNWLGLKRRSDWGSIPESFYKLMKENGFITKKFDRVKYYGPSKSHIVAYLQKI
tara:strand:+ start:932 stop:1777 length:846 start_codon:yes stop_codon:yes gene_type:complete